LDVVESSHVPVQSNLDGVISGKLLNDKADSTEEQTAESGQAETSEGAEVSLVESAYEHLKTIYRQNVYEAMVDAGRYIIDNFYEGDHKAALAKNKTKDDPQNLKELIDKIRKAPEGVPSVGWLYNAVNLAAHEQLCSQYAFQTFGMLGHSHKLLLLHVAKPKSVPADQFDAALQSAFEEKERLARHAYDNALSVRDFKNYIKVQHPSKGIDLTDLPPVSELR
jgi:hypothetical protein